jgi:hypothetical protein
VNARQVLLAAQHITRRVKAAFVAELGKPEKRPNPWPKCQLCYHRTDPVLLCRACGRCGACDETCTRCGRCVLERPGHKEETGQ